MEVKLFDASCVCKTVQTKLLISASESTEGFVPHRAHVYGSVQ